MAMICSVVSRASFFRSRHCLSLFLTLLTIARILFFLRSDLFVLSIAEQDKKKKSRGEKIFFFDFSCSIKRMLFKALAIRYFRMREKKPVTSVRRSFSRICAQCIDEKCFLFSCSRAYQT